MSISRRIFLRSGTMSAVAAGVSLGAGKLALGQNARRSSATVIPTAGSINFAAGDTLFSYGRAAFEPCIGSVFTVRGSGGKTVNLTLISISGYKPGRRAELVTSRVRKTDSFSLVFKAERQVLTTGTPSLSHPVLGTFDLFLTAGKKNGIFYEAVINHIV